MSQLKFVIVGGGSTGWTPRLATDYFLCPEIEGSKLVLVDLDRDAALLIQRYLQKVIEKIGSKWTVEVADLDDALDGADGVCVSISTGGFEAMQNDYHIPEDFGVYHTVGDTVGPGGISRTLRNVPVFVDIARRMEKLCPDTWLVHVTNPLAQITRCIWHSSGIRSLGLCHNFNGTRHLLSKMFDAEPSDIHATSVGVNHFTWMKNPTCRGEPINDQLTLDRYLKYEAAKHGRTVETGSLDDAIAAATGEDQTPRYLLNFHLKERFDLLPVGAASHVAENFAWYINDPAIIDKYCIRRKGVLPQRADAKTKQKKQIVDIVEGRAELEDPEVSAEGVAPIMVALTAGKPAVTMVNLPNEGQIPNLPRGAVVETWGVATWDSITPLHAGEAPKQVAGLLQNIIHEEELAVEAALTGCRRTFCEALHVSPVVRDKDRVEELADKLLAANAKWLPQFQGK